MARVTSPKYQPVKQQTQDKEDIAVALVALVHARQATLKYKAIVRRMVVMTTTVISLEFPGLAKIQTVHVRQATQVSQDFAVVLLIVV